MKQLVIYESVDGPPDFFIRMGFEWVLRDDSGKKVAECDNGFKTIEVCRAAVRALPLDWGDVEVVEIGKFNPDDPKEYVDGEYRGGL